MATQFTLLVKDRQLDPISFARHDIDQLNKEWKKSSWMQDRAEME